jgi:hypothetical protein
VKVSHILKPGKTAFKEQLILIGSREEGERERKKRKEGGREGGREGSRKREREKTFLKNTDYKATMCVKKIQIKNLTERFHALKNTLEALIIPNVLIYLSLSISNKFSLYLIFSLSRTYIGRQHFTACSCSNCFAAVQ